MPKKKNFLGGMQNYDPNNGQYEPALVGTDGEVPQKFTSFKKPKEEKKDLSPDEIDKQIMSMIKKGKSSQQILEHLEKIDTTGEFDYYEAVDYVNTMFDKYNSGEEGLSNEQTTEKETKKESLNDYTDLLFKKLGVKTYSSKKYKNPSGEIIEIRRFGEGKNAIRYNETKKIVEQVWLDGEKIN